MRLKSIFEESLHHSSTIIFLAGFIFDMVMLPAFEDMRARYIGLAHICIVASFIYIREWVVSRNTASSFEQKLFSFLTFFISFSSGAALSFVFVYSIRSAALSVSWPLFLILTICIFANEFVSTHNFRFSLDVGVLLIAVLFYIIFNAAFFLKTQNDMSFMISVGVAMIISLIYVHILRHSSYTANYEAPRVYALAIGIPLFVGMLYFLNIIPAVPLSLKEAGVYHHIEKTSAGDFIFEKDTEVTNFWSQFTTKTHYIFPKDDAVYFFSAIDTPAEITAPIYHVWEYYDNQTKQWIVSTIVPFDIQGGREDGYRAFSKKENITDGLWRVTVKVGTNRVIGREEFWVVKK